MRLSVTYLITCIPATTLPGGPWHRRGQGRVRRLSQRYGREIGVDIESVVDVVTVVGTQRPPDGTSGVYEMPATQRR